MSETISSKREINYLCCSAFFSGSNQLDDDDLCLRE